MAETDETLPIITAYELQKRVLAEKTKSPFTKDELDYIYRQTAIEFAIAKDEVAGHIQQAYTLARSNILVYAKNYPYNSTDIEIMKRVVQALVFKLKTIDYLPCVTDIENGYITITLAVS